MTDLRRTERGRGIKETVTAASAPLQRETETTPIQRTDPPRGPSNILYDDPAERFSTFSGRAAKSAARAAPIWGDTAAAERFALFFGE
jgi:hypothetical protein